jgi:hypothetical protein
VEPGLCLEHRLRLEQQLCLEQELRLEQGLRLEQFGTLVGDTVGLGLLVCLDLDPALGAQPVDATVTQFS